MASPPGGTARTELGGTTNIESVEDRVRAIMHRAASTGVPMSPSRASRLARAHKRRELESLSTAVWAAVEQRPVKDDPYRKRITYADPTGENATTNVKTKRGY